MKAIVFPGQGSQFVGMGKDLCNSFPEAKEIFEEVDDTLQQNLSQIMFDGPDEILTLTENTQPAIMSVGIAIIAILKKRGFKIDLLSNILAGHSLGEYTALAAADSLSLKDVSLLLKARGKAMQDAVPKGKGAMAAILGLSIKEVIQVINANELNEKIFPANDNADAQVVISGLNNNIEDSLEIFTKNGAKKALKLSVSAPFHCPLMEPAKMVMKQTLDSTELYKPIVPVLSNVSVESESSIEGIKNNLINQVTEMVRWREIMIRFEQDGVSDFYEIGSGSVLSNLAKRSCPSFNRKSINDKPSVENFLHSLDKRGTK
jgi:[acyl-carrier-protein] S-malonyltransferase